MNGRKFLRSLIPPIAFSIRNKIRTRKTYGFSGDYKSWVDAVNDSAGYDAPEILERVKAATLGVTSGGAVCERDSVLFDKMQYSWPVIAGLLRVASSRGGCLSVLDFGGSLGSSFRQSKGLLSDVTSLKWCVVEQPSFVAAGNALAKEAELTFYSSVSECQENADINVILLSGVLQYLEKPYASLQGMLDLGVRDIIVDRMPFLQGSDCDRLTVQSVPPSIYSASFPHWFFSKPRFLNQFYNSGYEIVAEFESFDKANVPQSAYLGFIFSKRP